MSDPVGKPDHYYSSEIAPIDVILDAGWGEGFCLGNVLKYVLRHQYKGGLEDLKKARWYLDRYITHVESTTPDTKD